MKKRPWSVRRDIVHTMDAQRRWDHAYQLLTQWSRADPEEQALYQGSRETFSQEDVNAYCNICAGVDPTAGIDANH
jgi:hypothetical protein